MNFLTPEQLQQLQIIFKTLSKHQLIWVSGYIWGLINSQIFNGCIDTTEVSKTKKNKNPDQIITHIVQKKYPIIIISASQTGNARRIAQQLYENFININSNVVVVNIGDYEFKKINEARFLIFITSTHGEGSPPEEAIPFHRYLFSKKAPDLKNINFTVLGLGDSSYKFFAKAGKDFDKRFEELGGHRLYNRVDLDVDYLHEFSIWKKQIIPIFQSKQSTEVICDRSNSIQKIDIIPATVRYSKEFPLIGYLSCRQKITSCLSTKDVHHLEIDVTGSDICYQPGDALGVWYENDPHLIDELLQILCLTGQELVEVKGQSISLNEALKTHYELTQNHLSIVHHIAMISKSKLLLDLMKDQKKLSNFITQTPVVDMFRKIPVRLMPQDLLKTLKPMQPRFYSISSAQSEVGEEIHITVSVIRYKIDGHFRSGGASSYLVDRLHLNDEIRIFIEKNNNFRLPNNPSIPIIMIGAGTGIAPFRAFIQQRAIERSIGKNWLFFGYLKFVDDFLYQVEWQRYVKLGLLNKIDTAWSRDQQKKVYVQDKLRENGMELWDWIKSGAHVYVCGDAKHMASDVEKTLIFLTSKYGSMNSEQSIDFWDNMRIQHRYQRDIY